MLRGLLSAGSAVLRAALVVVLVVVVAVESIVFAVALSSQAIGVDGQFQRGLLGFAVHLTLFLLALVGLRALTRRRPAVRAASTGL
jgi:hypothetical protein